MPPAMLVKLRLIIIDMGWNRRKAQEFPEFRLNYWQRQYKNRIMIDFKCSDLA